MFKIKNTIKIELENNLILKSVSSAEDVNRIAKFNLDIHKEKGIDEFVKNLLLNHPNVSPDDWLYIEDKKTNEVVSSLCLINWNLGFENISLKSAEMGFVGTKKEYRNKGLLNILAETFAQKLITDNYDISQIQGIPFFYKKYGYNYSTPLIRNISIKPGKIPNAVDAKYIFRKAQLEDLPALSELYNTEKLFMKTNRTDKIWKYLICYSVAETWVIIDRKNKIIGYFRFSINDEWGKNLYINEVSGLTKKQAVSLIHQLKKLCIDHSKPFIRFDLPESTKLVKTAKTLGAVEEREYAWQIKIVDIVKFLKKIKALINERLSKSRFKKHTGKLGLNIYKKQFELSFVNGELKSIKKKISTGTKSLRITEGYLTQLFTGYRSIDELLNISLDIGINNKLLPLINTIFPKKGSFLYCNY